MKSERRHALQENDLASHLGRINVAIQPYSKLIAVVLAALVLAVVALAVYQSQTTATRSDATLQLIEASASGDTEVLADVATRYPSTAAGAWARLYQGNQHLAEGMSALYQDEALAEEQFEQARSAFRQALDRGSERVLRSRAHLGLARIAEALGEVDQAVEAYREVIAVRESEAVVEKAQQRIDALAEPRTQEFLAWFSEQDFSPADPSLPPSLPSGGALPDVPDMDLPEMGQGAAEQEAAATESPADGSPLQLQDPLNLQDGEAEDGEAEDGEAEDGSDAEAPTEEMTDQPSAEADEDEPPTSTDAEANEPASESDTAEAESEDTAEAEGEEAAGAEGDAAEAEAEAEADSEQAAGESPAPAEDGESAGASDQQPASEQDASPAPAEDSPSEDNDGS